jgi:hypothetical protein
MVAEIVEVQRNESHLNWIIVKVQGTTAAGGDWAVIDGYKGVIPMRGMAVSINRSAGATPTWGVARIDNIGVAYGTTDTTIVCDECTITRTGASFYLITAGGEIMEVINDATPGTAVGTFTVRRGRLGTTASATGLADNNYLGIMNIVFCGQSLAGPHIFPCLALPNDSRYT